MRKEPEREYQTDNLPRLSTGFPSCVCTGILALTHGFSSLTCENSVHVYSEELF